MRALFVALVLASGVLPAQTAGIEGWEVYGHLGAGKAYDDEGNIGAGAAVGGGIGKRVSRRWGLEGEWSRFWHDRIIGGTDRRGHGDFFMGNGLLHFNPEGKVQPYLLVGGGLLKYQHRDAGLALNFGFGVKGDITEHWFIRPEFRVQGGGGSGRRSGPEPPISQARFQMGVGYRW